jgi:predicted Zn-dependent protease
MISACSTSPTGRNQLNLFGSSLDAQGAAAFSAMKQSVPLSTNTAQSQYVMCVVDALLPVTDKRFGKRDWEVAVFDDPQVNAFAVPGGKIGVYSGILNVATTPDQLAAIIGHEIAHVIAEHSAERATIELGAQALLIGSQVAMQANEFSAQEQRLYMSVLGLGTQVGLALPYSRTHESEADRIGLELMVEAGFSPYSAVELWEKMGALNKRTPPEFLSTHPAVQTRLTDLKAAIPVVVKRFAKQRRERPIC